MITKEKVKEFIGEYKMQLAVTAATVAGVAIWAITKDKASNYIDIAQPDLNTGEWTQIFKSVKGKYTGCITGMAKDVDLADLGKFGEALGTIDGISENEPIRIVFGTERGLK